ncbi:hypothetical protein APSETT444_009699 [Aspergillus pseudonomiae]
MTPFTIDNLPYGVISTRDNSSKRCAVAFQQFAIDLDLLYRHDFFASIPELDVNVFAEVSPFETNSARDFNQGMGTDAVQDNWNVFAVLPLSTRATVRARIRCGILDKTINKALVPLSNCTEVMKIKMSSNWFSIPSVYNGRTSSLAVSGTPVTRPYGMYPDPQTGVVSFQPESKLDFELEMGVWLSTPVPRGQRLDIAKSKEHIFGFTLLNDWSSRQIQNFEMTPLGCFHSKGSLTSVSPWIVPIEALEPFKCERMVQQDPLPMPHLMPRDDAALTYDIDLSVTLLRK